MFRKFKLALTLLLGITLHAQSNRGGITGTISDPSGATIPGATVKLTNIGTNQASTLKSSAEGSYTFSSLDPVYYRITVEVPGFKTEVVDQIKVDTATVSTANIGLQPGQVNTQVTITAEAPVVDSASGTLGFSISEKQIGDIPLYDRNILELVMMSPNLNGEAGTEDPDYTTGIVSPGLNIYVNGGRAGSTAILADGVNNTAIGYGRSIVSFSPDVVQEVTVQTSAFSAEYGQTGGGVINASTKSGTNRLSGLVSWYNRNPFFGAQPFSTATTNRPTNTLRSNQGGVIVGGPVVLPKVYNGRNKTFFFFAFEPRVYTATGPIDALLPTPAMRSGDFSDAVMVSNGLTTRELAKQFNIPITGSGVIYDQFAMTGNQFTRMKLATGQSYVPFPNNIIPASFLDPISAKVEAYVPLPAGAPFMDASNLLANYASIRYVRDDEKRYTVRLDHNITDSNRFNVRLTRVPIDGVRLFGDPNSLANKQQVNSTMADESRTMQIALSDTWIISPTKVNELHLNYTYGNFSRLNPPMWRTNNLNTELGLPSIASAGEPYFTLLETPSLFGNVGQTKAPYISYDVENTYGISDTFSWTHGDSTFKFGTDLRNQRQKIESLDYAADPNYTFSPVYTDATGVSGSDGGSEWASFLMGVPNSVLYRDAIIPYYYSWNSAAFFVQNDWKVRPNLTLNIGIRYSLQLPRTEKYNHQGVYLLDEAQAYKLASPITLPNGQVITSAMVPPFAFSGIDGRSRYLTNIDWHGLEPRFGFAWSPDVSWNSQRDLTVRGGYGLSHAPITGEGNSATPDFSANSPTTTLSPLTGGVNSNYIMRLSANPPNMMSLTPQQALNIPANGLVSLNSINIAGFAVPNDFKTPYVQNWNLTISRRFGNNSSVEITYAGSKGTHLFLPPANINQRSTTGIESMYGAGLDPDGNITDPLGRIGPTGAVLSVPRGSEAAPYLGFGRINLDLDGAAASMRHAGVVSFQRRFSKGFSFTANYTYSKSIDNASDTGSAYGLNALGPRTDGQGNLGNPLSLDRSVSTFDMRHVFNATGIYELPFGRGQLLLQHPSRWLEAVAGGWQISGKASANSGYPFAAFIKDSNGFDGTNDSVRMTLNPGVPLKNPLYSSSCPVGAACEPYFNPAAFIHPPVGQLGDLSRTLDGVRSPGRRYLDASMQKNFYPFGKDSSRRLQVRADFLNVLNHPNIFISPSDSEMYSTAISQSAISATEYNAWATYNGQPLSTTAAGTAELQQIDSLTTGNYLKGTSRLPTNFFSIAVPQGFATTSLYSNDIRTLEGLKLFRLRQEYESTFGALDAGGTQPRVIQFALRFYF
jgi:hypothetical protein